MDAVAGGFAGTSTSGSRSVQTAPVRWGAKGGTPVIVVSLRPRFFSGWAIHPSHIFIHKWASVDVDQLW